MKQYIFFLLLLMPNLGNAANISQTPQLTKDQKKIKELNNAMWNAVAKNDLPALKKLFGAKIIPEINNRDRETGNTVLFIPAWRGAENDSEMIHFIIQQGADVNIQGFDGRTALFTATMHGKNIMMQQLLEAYADPNIPDDAGKTALMFVAGFMGPKALERVKLLTAYGASKTKANEKDHNKTALDYAFDKDTLELAIKEGRNLYKKYTLPLYQEQKKRVQQAVEQHLIPPLASIVSEYALPVPTQDLSK